MKTYTKLIAIFFLLISTSAFGSESVNKKLSSPISSLPEKALVADISDVFWSINGYVYLSEESATPFPGVTITFSGLGSTLTNENGYYIFDVPHNWSGTVTPTFCGPSYGFQPEQRVYPPVKKNYTQQNYYAVQLNTFTISGAFLHFKSGEPLANTSISFTNEMSVTTNENGYYSLTVDPCWSDTLKPISSDWNFIPDFKYYSSVTTDFENQDFEYRPKSFGLPPGWVFQNTGTVHIVSVFSTSNPNICGVPLNQGDYIGVFYKGTDDELHCAGAGEWTGTSNTGVFIYGDDAYTPEKDGFLYGEVMNWKIFTWTTDEKEYEVYPSYQKGGYLVSDNKWYSGGLSIVNGLNVYLNQQIVIPEGWSGISGYVNPSPKPDYVSGNQIQFLLAPISDDLIIIQSLVAMYYPSQNIKTLINWNVNSGYKIKVNKDVTFELPGCPITDRTLSLTANWSIMPVKSECNVSVQALFSGIMNRVKVVKEIAGPNVFWPAMGISTLQVLEPGKAYMVTLTLNSSVTFPECTNQKSDAQGANAIHINKTNWTDPIVSPSNHIIAIESEAVKGFGKGDYLGAFTQDGTCAGLAEIKSLDENMSIALFGNDNTETYKTGFFENELITLKWYRTSTDEIFDLIAEFDPSTGSENGRFTDNGLSIITKLNIVSGTGETNRHITPHIFPNPTTGNINLIAPESTYTMKITDVLGNIIHENEYTGSNNVDLSHVRRGLYIVSLQGADFIKTEKLLLR